ERLPLPTLESSPSDPGEDLPGANHSNNHDTPMALSRVLIQEWHAGMVQNYKSAIMYMYKDKSSFSGPDFLSYFKAIKEQTVKDMKEINIDLQPILTHFRQQGPNKTLDTSALTRKLCWLLGTCGFLCPSDIWCIDLANENFAISNGLCKLPIVFPKETRDG
ncbi:hypothetical protein CPC16_005395, partial [Podila verticillata]